MNNYLQNACNTCNLDPETHFKYVDNLVLLKIIDTQTGESIKQNMAATFNNNGVSNQTGWNLNQYNAFKDSSLQKPNIEADFDISKSEFLKARECLLNYLQKLDIELNREDLKNIEAVVLELEKAALLRQQAKNSENAFELLNKNNEIAKERLMTGSMQGSGIQNPPNKTFSRDEIAKMSTAEFIKNEPIINYQLQNGLL